MRYIHDHISVCPFVNRDTPLSKNEPIYLSKNTDLETLQLICDGFIIERKQDNRLFLSAKGHGKVFDLMMTYSPSAEEACHAL